MYLFYYFKTCDEKLYRSTSTDGLHFENEQKVADFKLRDPCVTYDGTYILLASDGWNSTKAIYSRSEDGIKWDSPQYLTLEEPGNNVWAPKLVRINDTYFIIWASNPDNYIAYVHTNDFIKFSSKKVLFRPQYPIIDPFILNKEDELVLFFKNEKGKYITSLPLEYNPNRKEFRVDIDEIAIPITSTYTEGPFVIKGEGEKFYNLYCDPYANFCTNYKVYRSRNPTNPDSWIPITDVSFPKCRHGSVVKI